VQVCAFEPVWQKVGSLAGETFRSTNGAEFTYRFAKTYVVVSAGNQSIPRTYFEKVFRGLEGDTAGTGPPLQGQTFILGILTDPRLRPTPSQP
jgi:hypothetical protein